MSKLPNSSQFFNPPPAKYSVAQIVSFIKGKSAISIAGIYFGRRKNFTSQSFWAGEYYVTTVGRDEEVVSNWNQITHALRFFARLRPCCFGYIAYYALYTTRLKTNKKSSKSR